MADNTQSNESSPSTPNPTGDEPMTAEAAQSLWEELSAETTPDDEAEPPIEEKPAPPPPPEPTPAPTPAPEPLPQPEPTPQTSLTQEQLAALLELPAAVKAIGGRMAAMQSALDKGRQAAADAGAEAPTDEQVAAAGKNSAKWENLKRDFPEWAEGIDDFVNSKMAGASPDVLERLQRQESEAEALRKHNAALSEELLIVSSHPGWRRTVKSEAFVQWVKALPEQERQTVTHVRGAQNVIEALDKFEAHRKQSAASAPASPAADGRHAPDPELSAAATPRGAGRTAKKSVDTMSPEEQFAYYASQG